MAILEAHNVTKRFDQFIAVDSISFQMDSGNIYGLLGPNGAGKTTTIRMIMNILIPDSGTITLFDQPLTDTMKHQIGYLPEERGLYPKMKTLDLLIFFGEMHGLTHNSAKERALFWLERMEFSSALDKTIQEMSKGMQQKIQIISSLIHDPDLIILDEPFSGLDPVNINIIKDIILDLKKQNKTIMLSTHLMDTAEKLCDEVLLINNGKKILDGNLNEIRQSYGKNAIQLEYTGDASFLKNLDFVKHANDFGNYLEIELKENGTPNLLLKEAIKHIEINKMVAKQSSLNEIFIELVKGKDIK
ncbi:MAG TPA: ATP-binding cassette domain-containing protein [Caldithrix abyssi]|uniref:ATP-binding cassette domain-containing protein n=1 Tax=Caldithrix abyssi TaxID=187145 RepID=A0A7V4U027_CALAY|nr:ATP-binding cassette domain-containing protein [Caldithrix abyssi]